MSLQEKILKLERFLIANPAFRDVPILTVEGKPLTVSQVLASLRAGRYVDQILSALARLEINPEVTEELWLLTEEFWKKIALAKPTLRIATIGYVPVMSPSEALKHIKARDEIGRTLVQRYSKMLDFMKGRMEYA